MTQAYNLSQLANNLNSTGQLDATDGLVNAVPVTNGGTGASTAAEARSNLGLGTIATQAANSVSITGGSITGITDLAVADGGTGASTASAARTNLGVPATDGTGASGTWGINISGNAATATTATNSTNGLGVGQTWQTFSSPARQSGVTYTNSTAKPIAVSLNFGAAFNGAPYSVYVDGVLIVGGTIYSNTVPYFFIVPSGSTYQANCGQIGWAELR